MNREFTVRFTVRFRDVDVLGHVNNAVYFTYMRDLLDGHSDSKHNATAFVEVRGNVDDSFHHFS